MNINQGIKEEGKRTMGEMLCIGVWIALQIGLVHVQELGEKFHCRLRADIQGLHNRQNEGCQELSME